MHNVGDVLSTKFEVVNEVRQRGILSPYPFNVYVGKLSEQLKMWNVGYNMNGHLINYIMYADNLVLISPSTAGLCHLLHKCEQFGISHDVKYNAKKSAVMIFSSVTFKKCSFPGFKLHETTCLL